VCVIGKLRKLVGTALYAGHSSKSWVLVRSEASDFIAVDGRNLTTHLEEAAFGPVLFFLPTSEMLTNPWAFVRGISVG
jgi:hypothetical protein